MPLLRARTARVVAAVLLAVAGRAGPALAQAAGAGPDLNALSLDWARGNYGAPLVCEVEGSPVRAVRRVLIAPVPGSDRGPMDKIQFPDPEAKGATRCFSELGVDEPLVDGSLTISLPGRSRPDTARYDFGSALRRENGFRFDVRSGKLSVKGWGPGNDETKLVEFTGGHASLHGVAPGSDAERLLRSFTSPRKLILEIEAPDGTKLSFALFQIADR
jgi:hypothetical protein